MPLPAPLLPSLLAPLLPHLPPLPPLLLPVLYVLPHHHPLRSCLLHCPCLLLCFLPCSLRCFRISPPFLLSFSLCCMCSLTIILSALVSSIALACSSASFLARSAAS